MTPVCWAWELPTSIEGDPLTVLKEWQAGRCALCGSTDRKLVLDHNHENFMCRGYLCQSCNVNEGYSKGSDIEPFRSWRETNACTLLGLQIKYTNPTNGIGFTWRADSDIVEVIRETALRKHVSINRLVNDVLLEMLRSSEDSEEAIDHHRSGAGAACGRGSGCCCLLPAR